MTNHHCGVQCVEQLSTARKNFVQDGFLARGREEEIRCPEIELNRLEEITDVTLGGEGGNQRAAGRSL